MGKTREQGIKGLERQIEDLKSQLDHARLDNQKLVRALNYYADADNYKAPSLCAPEIYIDRGELARKTVTRYAIDLKRRRTNEDSSDEMQIGPSPE